MDADEKIGILIGKVDSLIDGFDKMNGRVWKIDKVVAGHEERIEDVEERPSATKAVIWTGSIIGIFVCVATIIAKYT